MSRVIIVVSRDGSWIISLQTMIINLRFVFSVSYGLQTNSTQIYSLDYLPCKPLKRIKQHFLSYIMVKNRGENYVKASKTNTKINDYWQTTLLIVCITEICFKLSCRLLPFLGLLFIFLMCF